MAYNITIEQVQNNVVVTPPAVNQVSVSTTNYPITISYNATVIEGGGIALNGLPAGGTAGQILSKLSSTDYAAEWVNPVDLGITDIVQDTTPQLGGNLDVNGRLITSAGNAAVTIRPNGTGSIFLQNSDQSQEISLTNLDGLRIVAGTNRPGSIEVGANQQLTIRAPGTGGSVFTNGLRGVKIFTDVSTPTITTNDSVGGITISTNNGVNTGSIVINAGANGNIAIAPSGTGSVVLDGTAWPQDLGTDGQVLRTTGTGTAYWDDEQDITTVSENEPQVADIGDQWFNPTTQILNIYTAAGFVQVTADDLQF